MKNLKKLLAVVLACTMVFGVVSFAAIDTGYSDVAADAKYAEAVKVLSSLGIVHGDDKGLFNPAEGITRAETAVILCSLYGAGEIGQTATVFADVPASHWGSGYINYANQLGFIAGYGDGNFGPEDKVTYEQFIKMVVCALGYEKVAKDNGGYPSGYMMVAADKELTKKVTIKNQGDPALRSDVAQIAYNALTVNMMKRTVYGDLVWEEESNDTLLTLKLGAYKLEGYVADTWIFEDDLDEGYINFVATVEPNSALEDEWAYDAAEGTYTFANIKCLDEDAPNITGYQTVAYIAADDEGDYSVVAIAVKTAKTTEFTVEDPYNFYNKTADAGEVDAEDFEGYLYYWKNRDDKKISSVKVDDNAVYYVNGVYSGTVDEVLGARDETYEFVPARGTVTVIDTNGDNKYDLIKVKSYDLAVVNTVTESTSKIAFKADVRAFSGAAQSKIVLDPEEVETIKSVKITLDGEEAKVADLEENDVLWISVDDYDAPHVIDIIATRKTVEGKVNESGDTDDFDRAVVTIDGTKYTVAFGDVAENAEGTFYLDPNGDIVMVDADTSLSGNYAYLTAVSYDADMDEIDRVRAFTLDDGKHTTFTVGSSIKVDGDKREDLDAVAGALRTQLADDETALINYTAKDGVLTKVNFVGYGDFTKTDRIEDAKWDADNNRFIKTRATKNLADNAKVFWFDDNRDSYKVTDTSALVDEGEYTYVAYTPNKDNQYEVAIIFEGGSTFNVDGNFAIYEKKTIATVNDVDGYRVYFWANGTEAENLFVPDENDADFTGYAKGDVFYYTLDEDGNIDKERKVIDFATFVDAVDVANYSVVGEYVDAVLAAFDRAVDISAADAEGADDVDKEFAVMGDDDTKDSNIYFGFADQIKSVTGGGVKVTMLGADDIFTISKDALIRKIDVSGNKTVITKAEIADITATSFDVTDDKNTKNDKTDDEYEDVDSLHGLIIREKDGDVTEVIIVSYTKY